MKRVWAITIGLIMILWLLLIVPIWWLASGFAGEMVFIPDNAFVSLEGTLYLFAMYLPPLISLALLLKFRGKHQ